MEQKQWQIPVEGSQQVKILFYPSLGSTNTEAAQLAKRGESAWTVVYAAEQTSGKGRHNRPWWSPAGLGLWFSVILRPAIGAKSINLVNLTSALIMRQFLEHKIATAEKVLKPQVQLKWPNDILVDGRKICGILLESDTVKNKIQHIIAGIGININQVSADFPPELRKSAISLKMCTGSQLEISQVLNELIKYYYHNFNETVQRNFDNIITEYEKFLVYQGREVKIFLKNEVKTGVQDGIDNYGNLILSQDGRKITVSAGDLWLINNERTV